MAILFSFVEYEIWIGREALWLNNRHITNKDDFRTLKMTAAFRQIDGRLIEVG